MFCQKCGAEMPEGTKFCPSCGAPTGGAQTAQPEKKKKKRRPVLGAILLILGILIIVGVVSGGGDSQGKSENGPNETQPKTVANTDPVIEGKIGDYIVTIKESKVTTDFEGEKVLVVTYSFTNNHKESRAFLYSLNAKCFQNGVELGNVFTSYGIDGYSFDNQSKEIKTGVTLDVQVAYKLNDETTDVDVEISPIISFNDEVLTYQIKIS